MFRPNRKRHECLLLAVLLLAGCSTLSPILTITPPATQTTWFLTPTPEEWTVTPTHAPQRGVVIDGPLNVRTGPGLEYPVTRQLMIWTVVRVIGNSADGKWLLLDSGEWVNAAYVRLELS